MYIYICIYIHISCSFIQLKMFILIGKNKKILMMMMMICMMKPQRRDN